MSTDMLTVSPSSTMPLIPPQRMTSQATNGLRRLRLYLLTLASLRPRRREKIAFLIGIGYKDKTGKKYELNGAHKDIESLEELLRNDYGFDKFIVLSDRKDTPPNMRELKTIIPLNPGADFFFAYSGHSSQRPDKSGQEIDGKEEFIIPSDAAATWVDEAASSVDVLDHDLTISDKVLRECLVNCLPKRTHLTALFDTCHSGTLLIITEPLSLSKIHAAKRRLYIPRISFSKDGLKIEKAIASQTSDQKAEKKRSRCNGFCRRVRESDRQVICISACDDSQICVEDPDGGTMTRLMYPVLQAIVKLLKENKTPTYEQVIQAARDAVYEARKVRKARMEEYLSQKQCDITCSFLRHHRCLSAHERNLKKAARAEADPKVILV
ncbi:hypothetical protein CVT25_010485 [Psilocybe cyanescens]|uniref:Peptidase C14 caspase domain-containing protein n=1 Tax=Psilocybe cyanescens TaxID=93625 RepID=A0A409XDD4_PSICY|nr:hypothetical protein CVT25_010485 [Psilocybe cyanescens]